MVLQDNGKLFDESQNLVGADAGDLALQRVGREDGGLVSEDEKMRKTKIRENSSV